MSVLTELFWSFAKIGAFTFGGGYAMISLLEHEFVEKKRWLTADELMEVTVVAESTPGPIAINCATYTGYKQAGLAGAVAATVGMTLPSFGIILLISTCFQNLLAWPPAANAFRGIRLAVAVLIVQAAVKMIGQMLKKSPQKRLSMAFVAVFFGVVLVLNLRKVQFSTIYLILISGAAGCALFAKPQKSGVDE